MSSSVNDIITTMTLMESNNSDISSQAKNLIQEAFTYTKESWLLNGLFDYYINSDSTPCMEILVTVRDPHDKFLFDKFCESVKQSGKQQLQMKSVVLLCHVIRRGPSWLHKIGHHPLLKELMKLSRSEQCHLTLMISSLLALTSIMPVIPAQIGFSLVEFCDIFSHAAHVAFLKKDDLSEVTMLHLQMALFSMFNHLYGLYPCNFVSFLRQRYSLSENLNVFLSVIKPMLSQIRMHPSLVTTSKDAEVNPIRWKTLGERHDLLNECTRYSLECLVLTKDRHEEDFFQCGTQLQSVPTRGRNFSAEKFRGFSPLKPMPLKDDSGESIWSPTFMWSSDTAGHHEGTKPSSQSSLPSSPQEYEANLPRRNTSQSKIARALNAKFFQTIKSGSDGGEDSAPTSPLKKNPPVAPRADADKPAVVTEKLTRIVQETSQNIDVPGARVNDEVGPIEFSDDPVQPGRQIPRPIPTLSASFDYALLDNAAQLREVSQLEDQEITDIVNGGPREKASVQRSDSVIKDGRDQPLTCGVDSSGSVFDQTSMGIFFKKVSRLRFYSHCITSHTIQKQDHKLHKKKFKLSELKRTNSLPVLLKGKVRFEKRMKSLDKTHSVQLSKSEKSTQTSKEAFDVLYPCVIDPTSVSQRVRTRGESGRQTGISPMSFVQKYMDCIMRQNHDDIGKGGEPMSLKFENYLMSIQLLYERTKRNINVRRNHRLLANLKEAASLKECNSALQDQIAMLETEGVNLRHEIHLLRQELRKTKEDCDKKLSEKAQQIANLSKCQDTRESLARAKDRDCNVLQENLSATQKELETLKAWYFKCENELKHCRSQMDAASDTREELLRLKKEMVLLGELNKRLQDRWEKCQANSKTRMDVQFLAESYHRDVNQHKEKFLSKSAAYDVVKTRVSELEGVINKKETVISDLRRRLEDSKRCHEDKVKILQDQFTAVQKINTALEESHLKLSAKNETLARKLHRALRTENHGSDGLDMMSQSPSSDVSGTSLPREEVSLNPQSGSARNWEVGSQRQMSLNRSKSLIEGAASSRGGFQDLSEFLIDDAE